LSRWRIEGNSGRLNYLDQAEERIHSDHLLARTPKSWVTRDRLDSQLGSLLNRIFGGDQTKSGGGFYIQIHGPPGSGKSASLCRLHQMVGEKLAKMEEGGAEGPILLIR
jgi:Cdc6-like AAA superfamily ATPase